MLSIEKLSYEYEPEKPIFKDISISIKKGEVLTILGPNGAGKSTLIKCLVGILPPSAGKILIHGEEISSIHSGEKARKLAYVPQTHQIVFPFSVLDYVLMGRAPYLTTFANPGESDYRIAFEAIRKMGIEHLTDRPVSEISGGEFQLVSISRAIAQEPEILVLDEPTSHLDFGNQFKVLGIIQSLADHGYSVIMSSHFPDHAFLISDQVAVMQSGTFIGTGTPKSVITTEVMKQAYGIDVTVCYVSECGRTVCLPAGSLNQVISPLI